MSLCARVRVLYLDRPPSYNRKGGCLGAPKKDMREEFFFGKPVATKKTFLLAKEPVLGADFLWPEPVAAKFKLAKQFCTY